MPQISLRNYARLAGPLYGATPVFLKQTPRDGAAKWRMDPKITFIDFAPDWGFCVFSLARVAGPNASAAGRRRPAGAVPFSIRSENPLKVWGRL